MISHPSMGGDGAWFCFGRRSPEKKERQGAFLFLLTFFSLSMCSITVEDYFQCFHRYTLIRF